MNIAYCAAVATAFATPAGAEVLNVYGPEGPAPAMKEAAMAYRARTGT